MMTIKRLASLVFAIVAGTVASLNAATPSKFRPAGSSDPEIGRYLITVGDASEDIDAMKQEAAALYGARIEAEVSAGVRQFAVTMTRARARLLSADPRVVEVAEVPETAPAPPSAASARHFAPHALGYGDNGQSGTYTYDSSGNITAIGTDTYLYDAEGRLKESVTRGVTETYTYDAFGNRKTATGATNCLGQTTCATTVTVESSTNHLINSGVTYDAAGNVTTANGGIYTYDGTGMMIQATVGSDDRQFVYTADDERIAIRQGVSWTWTVRDPGAKVLREFTSMESTQGVISSMTSRQWLKDYVWRDGLLLATTAPGGITYHYHLDHLGTPRLITDANHIKVAEHAYYPFGAEIALTPHEATEEAMKFTGHERDIIVGDGHTLDDMHARYFSAALGRFLSVDPAFDAQATMHGPQMWNGYSYVHNQPTNLLDPTGRLGALFRLAPDALNETWAGFTAEAREEQSTNEGQSPSLVRTAVASALGLTHYRRSPDYLSATVNIGLPIPHAYGLISYAVNMIVDRYGRIYWAPLGAGAGKSFLKGGSAGVTAGWLLQKVKPSREELNRFITAFSANGSGGYLGGGGLTWGGTRTPGSQHAWGPGMGFAAELGFVSPQWGTSVGYTWQTWFHLGNGWD